MASRSPATAWTLNLHTYFGDSGRQTGIQQFCRGNGRPVLEVQNRSALHGDDLKGAARYGIFDSKSPLRPAIITEYLPLATSTPRTEPLMSALAGFQDLDGVFLFDLSRDEPVHEPADLSGLFQHDRQCRDARRGSTPAIPAR